MCLLECNFTIYDLDVYVKRTLCKYTVQVFKNEKNKEQSKLISATFTSRMIAELFEVQNRNFKNAISEYILEHISRLKFFKTQI